MEENVMATKTKNLPVPQNTGFSLIANTDFNEMIADELDGLDMGFERIKIPAGGVTMFELPGEDDEPVTVKEFSAVILLQHPLFAYYKQKYTGGNNPPDCGSTDGVIGVGEPGGSCKQCPLNQFGSGENGSKACKNRRRLYVLREGELFPLLLSLPTGSLKGFKRYIKQQLAKGRKTNAVVTRFALKRATNAGGIAYSQATFAVDRVLTPEEYVVIVKMSEQVKLYAENIGLDAENTVIGDEEIDQEPAGGVEPLTGGK